ncbi:initiation factor 2B-like protein [Halosimplex carlsbadense 2-9-1]|uniref:Initiation factor 2B-like protein n=1 Tax=Halosimplex carlsbadense 2-9-1 TaxID=797114 RepID=M0CPG4_9EURY|nr:translation initiation factor eIF-2B [Halosimplex carlsbadense]ELZ23774.1 initiation factor 2B-like protein [Halosimplex carlsbadense 2-9-1]
MIDETVEEIADMQTHSSSVVAVKAAEALLALTEREYPTVEEYVRTLERNSHALRRANPSHASLQTTQREILSTVEEADADSVDAAKDRTHDAVESVAERVESAKERAAERAVGYIEDGTTLLTHDYSSTVLEAIERTVAAGAELEVYCTEARPRYLGRKMVRTLADLDGVDAHLIVDGAAGHFLPDIDQFVVGMDCIVEDTLYNRIGTYPLAATAHDSDVPVRVVGAEAKVVTGGFAFENEHRSVSEVIREPADGFTVENPAYDATPTRLLDAAITDEQVHEF